MSDLIYGIDLGTTNTLVSIYNPQSGKSKILSGLIPSVVDMSTGEVGESQKKRLCNDVNSKNILSSFKVDITTYDSGKPSVQASKFVLKECKKFMTESNRAVISIPAYFLNHQREATKIAAESVGIKVESLINEPTAAALYYSKDMKEKAVIYDLGGGTFDATVIDTGNGFSDVQATGGDKIGGTDLDKMICEQIYEECDVKWHKVTDELYKSILEECEKLKIQIQNTKNDIVFDFSNKFFNVAFQKKVFILTVDKYKNLLKQVFARTISILENVIYDSGYCIDDMKLILVGGSTRDPYLVELISTIKQPEPVNYNPDEIVTQGAAYYAYLLFKGLAYRYVSDITKGLGIKLASGLIRYIIEPNSKIPISNKVLLFNENKTNKLQLELYQGDCEFADEKNLIGKLIYPYRKIVEAEKGIICATVSVEADGVIYLSARESLGYNREIKIDNK